MRGREKMQRCRFVPGRVSRNGRARGETKGGYHPYPSYAGGAQYTGGGA